MARCVVSDSRHYALGNYVVFISFDPDVEGRAPELEECSFSLRCLDKLPVAHASVLIYDTLMMGRAAEPLD
jgi:hypothetical protein